MNDPNNKFSRARRKEAPVLVAEDAPVSSSTKFRQAIDNRRARARDAAPAIVAAPPKTTSGHRLTPELKRLREEAYAKPEAPPDIMPDAEAMTTRWCRETPNGRALKQHFANAPENSPAAHYCGEILTKNLISIGNLLDEQLQRGAALNLNLVTTCYVYLRDHNHIFPTYKFDPASGGVVKPRGSSSGPEPTVYPVFVSEAEKAQQAAAARQSEEARLRQLPLEELKKLAMKDRKFPKPGRPGSTGGL